MESHNKKNISFVSENFICSACGACNAVCAKNAISMRFTNIGRKYAYVNEKNCVNCGLCVNICPTIDKNNILPKFKDPYVGNIINTYVGRANDEKIYKNAQSGGMATAILKYLFEKNKIDGAVVCRMSPGKTPIIMPYIAKSVEDLSYSQKSCYTPVDVLSVLKASKDYKSLAIVGLPCHIEGAKELLESTKNFENIKYLIGLICDRTLCAGIQEVMASYTKQKEIRIEWRKKNFYSENVYYPYKTAPVALLTPDGEINKILPNKYRFALKDTFTAPRCRICSDKLNIHADIVVGDPWRMSNVDWNHGDSVVLTRTVKGQEIIDDMIIDHSANLNKRANYQEVIEGQGINKRKEQTEKYKIALNDLYPTDIPFTINENISIEEKELAEKKQELLSFISLELKDKNHITNVGRAIIRNKYPKHKLSIIKRIVNKIKRTIKLLRQ